jgi:hypothetical protein
MAPFPSRASPRSQERGHTARRSLAPAALMRHLNPTLCLTCTPSRVDSALAGQLGHSGEVDQLDVGSAAVRAAVRVAPTA